MCDEGGISASSAFHGGRRGAEPIRVHRPKQAGAASAHPQDRERGRERKETRSEYSKVVHKAIEFVSHEHDLREEQDLKDRMMVMRKTGRLMSFTVVLHDRTRKDRRFLEWVRHSVTFGELQRLIKARCGLKSPRFPIMWYHPNGTALEVGSQRVLDRLAATEWCAFPWDLHVYSESERGKIPAPLPVSEATALFERYDLNAKGLITERDLARLFKKLDLERLDCSKLLIDRFIHDEFTHLDADCSGSVGLPEFTNFVAAMTPWMRSELMADLNAHSLFEDQVSRAVQICTPALDVPRAVDDGTGRGAVSVIEVGKFGIRLETPKDASEEEGSKVIIATRTATSVLHLSDVPQDAPFGWQRPCEFSFSPIVSIEYPATESQTTEPSMPCRFKVAPTLVMPHCFDPKEEESCVVLGAPQGTMQWEPISFADSVVLEETQMRVRIPYAGVFGAFTSPVVEDVAAVRFHMFTLPDLRRDIASVLRVHLCPELPNVKETMVLAENSEWGASTCVGMSPVLHLCQGARFRLMYRSQEAVVTWHGSHIKTELVIPAMGDEGCAPSKDDPDERHILNDVVTVDVIEGEGKRGTRVAVVAKRAGIPVEGYAIPFSVRLRNGIRPPPPVISIMRTAYDFHLTWKNNRDVGKVTHYAIEMSTTTPDGQWLPWQVLWIGAAHTPPDFDWELAVKTGDKDAQKKLKELKAKEDQAGDGNVSFSYRLPVDPNLVGLMRMRCWADGEVLPSQCSNVVKITRWNFKVQGKDAKRAMLEEFMRAHFGSLSKHVTVGRPAKHRIGNQASLNVWGGDSMPPADPPPPGTPAMPPVPYDVPKLPPDIPLLAEAGTSLAMFFRQVGVKGGGGGLLFGLRIDQVLQAVVGTPAKDGKYSPTRTRTTLQEPLMALCEVCYADALIPLLDDIVVLHSEWQRVIEKVGGIVSLVVLYRSRYHTCVEHVKYILTVMHEIHEMMAQCQDEDSVIAFHLYHDDYPREFKKELKAEVSSRIWTKMWKLSTKVLELQRCASLSPSSEVKLSLDQGDGEPPESESQNLHPLDTTASSMDSGNAFSGVRNRLANLKLSAAVAEGHVEPPESESQNLHQLDTTASSMDSGNAFSGVRSSLANLKLSAAVAGGHVEPPESESQNLHQLDTTASSMDSGNAFSGVRSSLANLKLSAAVAGERTLKSSPSTVVTTREEIRLLNGVEGSEIDNIAMQVEAAGSLREVNELGAGTEDVGQDGAASEPALSLPSSAGVRTLCVGRSRTSNGPTWADFMGHGYASDLLSEPELMYSKYAWYDSRHQVRSESPPQKIGHGHNPSACDGVAAETASSGRAVEDGRKCNDEPFTPDEEDKGTTTQGDGLNVAKARRQRGRPLPTHRGYKPLPPPYELNLGGDQGAAAFRSADPLLPRAECVSEPSPSSVMQQPLDQGLSMSLHSEVEVPSSHVQLASDTNTPEHSSDLDKLRPAMLTCDSPRLFEESGTLSRGPSIAMDEMLQEILDVQRGPNGRIGIPLRKRSPLYKPPPMRTLYRSPPNLPRSPSAADEAIAARQSVSTRIMTSGSPSTPAHIHGVDKACSEVGGGNVSVSWQCLPSPEAPLTYSNSFTCHVRPTLARSCSEASVAMVQRPRSVGGKIPTRPHSASAASSLCSTVSVGKIPTRPHSASAASSLRTTVSRNRQSDAFQPARFQTLPARFQTLAEWAADKHLHANASSQDSLGTGASPSGLWAAGMARPQ